jgi:hypothetical protein
MGVAGVCGQASGQSQISGKLAKDILIEELEPKKLDFW